MSREEAIEELLFMKHIFIAESDADKALDMAIETLKEQKTGKWVGNKFGECSVCGHKGCASDIWDRCKKRYCPNCGAKMMEE